VTSDQSKTNEIGIISWALGFRIRLFVCFTTKKAMRGKRMAEKSNCYLAPFGGITRIRFKGFVQDVSAVSAPPLFCLR